ncbi:class I SAM-dependent methyltransferase [Achromobacter xylosoxidans]
MQSIYTDASVYKLLTPQDDAEHAFMCRLAGDAASILELASGCGNLAARLAQRADVTGVDASPEMVALATQAHGDRPGLCFVQGDMRTLRLERPFDLVMAVDNALQHACTDEALYAALGSIRAHMGPRSRALFQTGLREPETIDALNHARQKVGSATDASGVTFEIYGTSTFDPATRVNHRVFEIHKDGAKVAERTLSMRILDSAALQQALARAGFRMRARSTSRARKSSRKPGLAPRTPCAPTSAAPDRSAPRALTYWRRQAIRRPRQAGLRSATEARA